MGQGEIGQLKTQWPGKAFLIIVAILEGPHEESEIAIYVDIMEINPIRYIQETEEIAHVEEVGRNDGWKHKDFAVLNQNVWVSTFYILPTSLSLYAPAKNQVAL